MEHCPVCNEKDELYPALENELEVDICSSCSNRYSDEEIIGLTN